MHRADVSILYADKENKEQLLKTRIKALMTKSSQEFLITADNDIIRLDQILKINDLNFVGTNCSF